MLRSAETKRADLIDLEAKLRMIFNMNALLVDELAFHNPDGPPVEVLDPEEIENGKDANYGSSQRGTLRLRGSARTSNRSAEASQKQTPPAEVPAVITAAPEPTAINIDCVKVALAPTSDPASSAPHTEVELTQLNPLFQKAITAPTRASALELPVNPVFRPSGGTRSADVSPSVRKFKASLVPMVVRQQTNIPQKFTFEPSAIAAAALPTTRVAGSQKQPRSFDSATIARDRVASTASSPRRSLGAETLGSDVLFQRSSLFGFTQLAEPDVVNRTDSMASNYFRSPSSPTTPKAMYSPSNAASRPPPPVRLSNLPRPQSTWTRYRSEEDDAYYYYQPATGETLWELPVGAIILDGETDSTLADSPTTSWDSGRSTDLEHSSLLDKRGNSSSV